MKLVSIGIPTFNRKDGLLKSITSVLSQTYSNLEVIIGDNCSVEYDIDFIESIKKLDHRIKYQRHNKNLGPVGNFEFLKSVATGDYFMWLADDDWLDKDYISRCVEFLENNDDYILVNTNVHYYKNSAFYYSAKPVILNENSAEKRVFEYYRKVSENAVYYGLMKRKAAAMVKLKNVLGSDWLFVANIVYMGKVGGIMDVSLHRDYTWNSESIDKVVNQYGLSEFDKKYPYISIAINAKNEILKDTLYDNLSHIHRRNFAWKVFWIICKRRRIKFINLAKAFLEYYKLFIE